VQGDWEFHLEIEMNSDLQFLFEKGLIQLKAELGSYSHEGNIWKIEDGITNSAGVLTKHLLGNLNHFIGAVIGNTGYIRDRDREFASDPISREELLLQIDKLIVTLQQSFDSLEASLLNQQYPVQVFGHPMTYRYFLFHLLGHFNYHLGQINYHRRLLER
jgi:hypothetical protein